MKKPKNIVPPRKTQRSVVLMRPPVSAADSLSIWKTLIRSSVWSSQIWVGWKVFSSRVVGKELGLREVGNAGVVGILSFGLPIN